jgi:hypothetical protein
MVDAEWSLQFSPRLSWLYLLLGSVYNYITVLIAPVEVLLRRYPEK